MRRVELTIRGLILGVVICVVFTAANVYLGLKVGLTFASSIPAAVISMAVLRAFKNSTIQENNIVQTVASAAGTLSSIIFVLPGLVMIGWWTGFPFWKSFADLRDRRHPGRDVLDPAAPGAGDQLRPALPRGRRRRRGAEGRRRRRTPTCRGRRRGPARACWPWSSGRVVSALFALHRRAPGSSPARSSSYFRDRPGDDRLRPRMSLALLGVGHLVGLSVGIAMLVGLLIAWGGVVPILTATSRTPRARPRTSAPEVWRTKVRFIGAGAIGIAAIWTLVKLIGPVINGLRGAMAAQRVRQAGEGATLPRTEQDIPIGIVAPGQRWSAWCRSAG